MWFNNKYLNFGANVHIILQNRKSFCFKLGHLRNYSYFCSKIMDNKQKTLELGTKPVGKLLTQYALPAMVAMTASSLYNIIDRAFIGQVVGPEAIAGLGITFPLMNLSGAFGADEGVGASTCISVKLGQKEYCDTKSYRWLAIHDCMLHFPQSHSFIFRSEQRNIALRP